MKEHCLKVFVEIVIAGEFLSLSRRKSTWSRPGKQWRFVTAALHTTLSLNVIPCETFFLFSVSLYFCFQSPFRFLSLCNIWRKEDDSRLLYSLIPFICRENMIRNKKKENTYLLFLTPCPLASLTPFYWSMFPNKVLLKPRLTRL